MKHFWKNKHSGIHMSDHDYNFLSQAEKEQMVPADGLVRGIFGDDPFKDQLPSQSTPDKPAQMPEGQYYDAIDLKAANDYAERTVNGEYPMEITAERDKRCGASDFLAGVNHYRKRLQSQSPK